MSPRPRSITIISWVFIIFGSIALLSGAPFSDIKSHWYIHLSRIIQIVAGVFMFYGRNWASWLLVEWIAFDIVVGALHGGVMGIIHVVICSVILFVSFRRPESGYFARSSV